MAIISASIKHYKLFENIRLDNLSSLNTQNLLLPIKNFLSIFRYNNVSGLEKDDLGKAINKLFSDIIQDNKMFINGSNLSSKEHIEISKDLKNDATDVKPLFMEGSPEQASIGKGKSVVYHDKPLRTMPEFDAVTETDKVFYGMKAILEDENRSTKVKNTQLSELTNMASSTDSSDMGRFKCFKEFWCELEEIRSYKINPVHKDVLLKDAWDKLKADKDNLIGGKKIFKPATRFPTSISDNHLGINYAKSIPRSSTQSSVQFQDKVSESAFSSPGAPDRSEDDWNRSNKFPSKTVAFDNNRVVSDTSMKPRISKVLDLQRLSGVTGSSAYNPEGSYNNPQSLANNPESYSGKPHNISRNPESYSSNPKDNSTKNLKNKFKELKNKFG